MITEQDIKKKVKAALVSMWNDVKFKCLECFFLQQLQQQTTVKIKMLHTFS